MIETFGSSPARPLAAIRPAPIPAETSSRANSPSPAAQVELSDEAQRVVRELEARDREVRQHEEAHARVGGQYAGQPQYQYTEGPDGKRYATSGSVAIDVSPVPGDPQATIEKMEIVKKAALAPARPSQQDRAVAAQADATRIQAEADKRAQAADADPDDTSLSVQERRAAELALSRDPQRAQDGFTAYASAQADSEAGAVVALAA